MQSLMQLRSFARIITAMSLIVVTLVVPFASRQVEAATITNGDCVVDYTDGAGGDANLGVVVNDIGIDCVVTFTRAGGTRTTWVKPLGVTSVRVLVVGAGGDSGLSGSAGKGAGGGGQVIEETSYTFASAAQNVWILPYEGGSTSSSYFDPQTTGLPTISAEPGGEGSTSSTVGGDTYGGSGGGASAHSSGRLNLGGAGIGAAGRGYAGGNSSNAASAGAGGGGGGGACGIGGNGSGTTGGDGGVGCGSDITGTMTMYGGGGGGGGSTPGSGQHGGGNGSAGTTGNNGIDNTGGGAGAPTTGSSVAEGGDGVVIVRYTPTAIDTIPPTLVLAPTSSTSSSASITFTLTGNEAIDCATVSTSNGVDFTFSNISSISVAQTSSSVCTITATSSATAGGGTVTSQLTRAPSFSVADIAGNAQTAISSGSPASVQVTIPGSSDTTPPTASWSNATTSNSRTFTYTLTFSEPISGLSASSFTNTGTATGCTFAPSASAGTTVTVTVTCTGSGTLVSRLNSNSVQDAAGNQGPTSATSSTSSNVVCPQAGSVAVRAAESEPVLSRLSTSTTNGGWGWVPGASGSTRVIDGTTWNFNSQRRTTLSSGTRVTIQTVGAGVGIQSTDQAMSARGGAIGMFMNNSIVSAVGAQVVTTDDGCTYGVNCANRGQFRIQFSPPAVDPVLHFSGIGGGGFDSATNGRTTSWTELEVLNPNIRMTLLGQKNIRLVGTNRIELATKNPTTNCSTTSNNYGATASAGCASVQFSGTFSEITLQADLNSVNNGNPYVGGRLEDAFIVGATVNLAQRLVVVTTTTTPTTTTTAPSTTTTTTTVPQQTTTTTTLPGTCPPANNNNNSNNNNNNSNNNNNNNNNSNNNNSNNNNSSGGGANSSSGGTVEAYAVDGAKDLSVVTPDGPARINPLNAITPPSGSFRNDTLRILDPRSRLWVTSYTDTNGTYSVMDGRVIVTPSPGAKDAVTMKSLVFKISDNAGEEVMGTHSVLIGALESLPEDLSSVVADKSGDALICPAGGNPSVTPSDVFDSIAGETFRSSTFAFSTTTGTVRRLTVPQGTWYIKNGVATLTAVPGFKGNVRVPATVEDSKGVQRFGSILICANRTAAALPATGSSLGMLLALAWLLMVGGLFMFVVSRNRSVLTH